MEPETLEAAAPTTEPTPTTTMELHTTTPSPTAAATADKSVPKRDREEAESESGDGESKKQKLEGIAEEDEAENDGQEEEEKEEKADEGPVKLGPKSFGTSVEMFDYFYGFLHHWPPNVDVNKYEHMALLDLIQKGHSEPEKKVGVGIQSFQVRDHPVWKSRCFFLVRTDKTYDDFSFRKCVDHMLALPENMKIKPDVNKVLGGGGHAHASKGGRGQGKGNKGGGWGKGGRGGRGRGRGRGR